jgi:hypothetical protein
MNLDPGGLRRQFLGGTAGVQSAEDQFRMVAQAASPDLLSQGLSAMFRSDQTAAFGQMVGQLFGQANPAQQAGMLNQLLGGMSPGLLSLLAGGAGGLGLAAIIGQLIRGGAAKVVTPVQAARLTPQEIAQIASHAEHNNPGIVDRMSRFYAGHPDLVMTLGGAALSIALAKFADGCQA